jgi:hypothetical protein
MAYHNGELYDPCPGWLATWTGGSCGMVGRTRVGREMYCKHCAWMMGWLIGEKKRLDLLK